MRGFIYIGGELFPDAIEEHPDQGDLVIAADSGFGNALKLGVTPAVVLGDFDSWDENDLPDDIKKIPFPPEKDYTDTQLAVEYAVEQGCQQIVLIGGLSGRLDHTLSNLAILEDLEKRHLRGLITDGFNRARFIRNDSAIILRSPHFQYLSILAADPLLKGVEIDGCKYPLKKAKIKRTSQFAVSNEITGNCAFVAIRRGGAWIVESKA